MEWHGLRWHGLRWHGTVTAHIHKRHGCNVLSAATACIIEPAGPTGVN